MQAQQELAVEKSEWSLMLAHYYSCGFLTRRDETVSKEETPWLLHLSAEMGLVRRKVHEHLRERKLPHGMLKMTAE
jgi:hypothetical protein